LTLLFSVAVSLSFVLLSVFVSSIHSDFGKWARILHTVLYIPIGSLRAQAQSLSPYLIMFIHCRLTFLPSRWRQKFSPKNL
jgi:hypothetical protein